MRVLALLLLVFNTVSAAEVTLHRWSGALNVPDPVACTVDEKGRVYVSATTRRKVADLDIREHSMWIADDVGLTSVEAKSEFLKRELAPGKLRLPRGGLKDHNKDGSIDWKDLTVHSERIYQLRDTDGDGTADKMTVFAEGFNTEVTGIAAGILYHDGWVYATIAPDLWRLKDTNDDGVADVREVVAHGFGMHIAYAGHDMHGPRLGPDGRIYWSIGDKGVNVTSKEGEHWYYPHEGSVLRCEPDGSGFEVFAHGLRNVQEIAFDDFGNIFGVDNDADMPGEKERFVYITEQSDSGWRCGHQYMKTESRWMREGIWQVPTPIEAAGVSMPKSPKLQTLTSSATPLFITPPLANYSNGPAGFAHEPGTALGAHLRGHFILDQFPSGKMEAFTIKPKGSAFEMSHARLINAGIMGIGLSFGPDGALCMADWVGGYPLDEKGAIWRVDESGNPSPARVETQKLLSAGFDQREVIELQTLLGHADQRVRVGAQLALVKMKAWEPLLTLINSAKTPLLSRIHALWGYGIGLRHGEVSDTPLIPQMLEETNSEMLAQFAKVLGDAKASAASQKAIITLLATKTPRTRFHAAIALGKLKTAAAEEALWKMAAQDADDAWLRHAVVTGLAGSSCAENLAKHLKEASRQIRLSATLALSRQHSTLVIDALHDAETSIVDEAARAIHDDIGIPEALPALAALLDGQPASEVTTRRALNANLRLGKIEGTQRLLKAALAGSSEAFNALLVFTEPPRLDRVDGMARSYPQRDAAAIASAIETRVADMFALTNPELKAAAIELMVKLQLKVDARALQQIITDANAKPTQRVGALRLMAAQHADDTAFATTLSATAVKTAPMELRMESLTQTFKHQQDRAFTEASRILEQGSLPEKQAALKHLASAKGKAAEALMNRWVQRLAAGKVEPGLKLDILEAAQLHPALTKHVTTYQKSRNTAPRDDLIEGGDATNGKDIVTNHLGANCLACHTVEAKEGSQVGPLLKTIGNQRAQAELLESLLNPIAKIAPGYGLVSITMKDGSNLAGGLFKEDKVSVTLRLADGTGKKIPRAQIFMQTPPISMMPPMLGILTPREVRDVVAYLSALKPTKSKKQKNEH